MNQAFLSFHFKRPVHFMWDERQLKAADDRIIGFEKNQSEDHIAAILLVCLVLWRPSLKNILYSHCKSFYALSSGRSL